MMRSPFLSILLFLFVAIANSSAQKTVTIPRDVQAAAGQATAELNQKTNEIDKAVQNAAPDAHDKIKAIQAPTSSAVPVRVTIIQADQKKRLTDEVQSFFAYLDSKERMYSRLSIVLISLSAGLALVGSIAAFMSKTKTAGVISLIVAAVVGLSNAYPVSPLANFYGDLKSQTKLILADCNLANPYTETLYSANVTQYKMLILAERDRPSIGKPGSSAPTTSEEIKKVGITAKNADTAKAAAQEIVGFADANKPNQ